MERLLPLRERFKVLCCLLLPASKGVAGVDRMQQQAGQRRWLISRCSGRRRWTAAGGLIRKLTEDQTATIACHRCAAQDLDRIELCPRGEGEQRTTAGCPGTLRIGRRQHQSFRQRHDSVRVFSDPARAFIGGEDQSRCCRVPVETLEPIAVAAEQAQRRLDLRHRLPQLAGLIEALAEHRMDGNRIDPQSIGVPEATVQRGLKRFRGRQQVALTVQLQSLVVGLIGITCDPLRPRYAGNLLGLRHPRGQ